IIVVFSLYCINDRRAMNKYMFHPYSIYHFNEHYRFLTHAFIHGDYFHLLFNCVALYSIGLDLEEHSFPRIIAGPGMEVTEEHIRLAKIWYLVLFTGGIYAASITEYLRNKNNQEYSSLGASGAISSIMFCWIIVQPQGKLSFFFLPQLPGWVIGILLLGISSFLIRRKKTSDYTDNISHESHFWGALFGILFILIVKPSVFEPFFDHILDTFGLLKH
ncbi:MAG: rhomboid family intramembrane serine protease, partial [Bacteroidia bacterium]